MCSVGLPRRNGGTGMSGRPRLHYLDNLRAFAIILVIVLHAAITYMADPPSWWYVIDADRSVVFT
jgi:glucan biosynthesis protein C